MPTIKGPLTIGPNMTDADRAKFKPFIGLGNSKTENKVDIKEVEPEVIGFNDLKNLSRKQQNELCKELGMKGYSRLKEDELIPEILKGDKIIITSFLKGVEQ